MRRRAWCPECGLGWRDYEPGDPIRCPRCEQRVVLVDEDDAGERRGSP